MERYFRDLHRIEFAVTMACPGRCRHCQNGDGMDRSKHIDPSAAVRAVGSVCGRYRITSLMTFGGEPLLYPDTVCAIHRAGRDLGIEKRQLITNGFFSRKEERIEEVARMIAGSGVNDLLLSADAFHQQTIPIAPVLTFARAAAESGIPVTLSPAWLVSREDGNPYNEKTREILDLFGPLGVPVGRGNVIFPAGNALKYLADYFDENTASSPYEDDPEDIRALSVEADGKVLNGNIYKTEILDIMESYRP